MLFLDGFKQSVTPARRKSKKNLGAGAFVVPVHSNCRLHTYVCMYVRTYVCTSARLGDSSVFQSPSLPILDESLAKDSPTGGRSLQPLVPSYVAIDLNCLSAVCACAKKGLALPCASHSGEIALAGSRRLRSTLAAAPVRFARAVVAVAKNK